MQIDKCNTAYEQKQRKKSHDYPNRCRKKTDKIQHPFIINALKKLGIERTFLNIIKAMCDKLTTNIIINGDKLKTFPLKVRNQIGCPLPVSYSI
jgi:hypothetical protein